MRIDFRGVHDAVEKAKYRRLTFFQRPWVYEEVRSYVEALGRREYATIVIGQAAFTITDMLREAYRGRSKVLDKVGGFFDRTVPSNPVPVGDDTVHIDRKALIEAGIREYVQSRRLRTNADKEAREYFDKLHIVPLIDPIVMVALDGLSFSQLLFFSRWLDLPSNNRPRLVICSDGGSRWIDARQPIVRAPLTLDEVLYAVCEGIGASIDQTRSYFRIWQATQRHIQAFNHLSAYDANNFLRVAERLHEEVPSEQEVVEQIPAFVPAPVMFAEEANLIGLDRTAQQGADPMHVRGAARALKHQAQELAHAGIDNAIPRCTIALSRISHILERLELTSPTEQADVIELGVEVNALSRRAVAAQERLSDYASRELIGFLTEANSFFRRFDTWRSYESGTPNIPADAKTAAAALLVLENALKGGLLTAEARNRVSESFVGSPDLDDPGAREGVARATDSLTAAVSRRAMKTLGRAGSELEKEGTKRVVDFSLDFIATNSTNLVAFASTRAPWLGLVLRFLSQAGS